MNQLEQNVSKSFTLAKKDIFTLFTHVRHLYGEVEMLRAEVARLHTVPAKKVVASKTSTKVHADSCAFAKNIKPVNKISFVSKSDALNHGYAACACLVL